MKIERFFARFDQLADAPNAVAKLRELIVQLGVRGELVPNNHEDEAVRLNMSGNSSSDSLPRNWRSGVLGDAITLEYGDNLPAGKRAGSGEYPVYGSNGIVGTHDIFLTKEPAIIVGRKGSAGALNIADGPSWTTDVAYFVRPPSDLDLRFTYYLLSSLSLDKLGKGIKPGLSRKEAYDLPIALPPLAEQERIVAKVDELMALCDRLEAQQQERDTRHAALARASLARFAEAPTPANLDFLFHPSYNIPPADLRKSILTLAVQGKLVPQDPNDEPADALNTMLPNQLRAIADKVGARFSAPSFLVENSENLPTGWGAAAIQSIGVTQTGTTPSKSESGFTGCDIPFIKPGDIQGDEIDYENEGLSAAGLGAGRRIPKNSVLMVSIGGSIGKTAIVDRDVSCNQQINSVSPAECIDPRFVLMAIRSADFQSEVMNRAAQGTLPIISKGKWETIRIPIPPLAEQRRIVSKVDQLMALVGQLEAQLTTSRSSAEELMEAVVAELTMQN